MTPQEKADDLVNKHLEVYEVYDIDPIAIDNAIVTINEMISTFESLFMTEGSMLHQYLLDVKQELINMQE